MSFAHKMIAEINEIFPRKEYNRRPPITFGVADHWQNHRPLMQSSGPVYLARFKNVYLASQVRGVERYTAILDADCRRIYHVDRTAQKKEDLLKEKRYLNRVHLAVKRFKRPALHLRSSLLLNFPVNYGHWLTDAFPVIGLIRHSKPELLDGSSNILISGEVSDQLRSRFLEFLEMLGIPNTSVLFLDDYLDYRLVGDSRIQGKIRRMPLLYAQSSCSVENLYVVSGHVCHPYAKYPTINQFYKEIRQKISGGDMLLARRIFVSRKDAGDRFLENEDGIFDLLRNEGFTKVLGSELTALTASTTFSEAEMVVGVGGASLGNIVFLRPGAKFINLVPEDMQAVWYWDLANLMGLEYCEVRGKLTGGNGLNIQNNTRNNNNFSIPKTVVEQVYRHFSSSQVSRSHVH